jgi:cytochrome c553
MKKLTIAAAALALTGIYGNAVAGDAAAGQAAYAAKGCIGCHGVNGKSANPIWPNLAGQHAPYIVLSLKAYKAQERKSANAAQMYPFAGQLSDADMENIAAYLAGL